MWCLRVRRQLSAYTDGELSAAEARSVSQHLTHCTRCAEEQRGLQQLTHITAQLPEEELPGGLHSRIMARLAYADMAPATAATPPRRSSSVGPWPLIAFSGAAAALVIGVLHARPMIRPGAPTAPVSHACADDPARTPAPITDEPVAAPATKPRRKTVPVTTPQARPKTEAPVPTSSAPEAPAPETPRRIAKVQLAAIPQPAARPTPRTAPRPAPTAVAETMVTAKAAAEMPTPEAIAPLAGMQPVTPQATMDAGVSNASGSGRPEPVTAGMEKESMMRMAGAGGDTPEGPQDEEGLSMLRMFLEERNRTVPQPPLVDPGRERRMRKSL